MAALLHADLMLFPMNWTHEPLSHMLRPYVDSQWVSWTRFNPVVLILGG